MSVMSGFYASLIMYRDVYSDDKNLLEKFLSLNLPDPDIAKNKLKITLYFHSPTLTLLSHSKDPKILFFSSLLF